MSWTTKAKAAAPDPPAHSAAAAQLPDAPSYEPQVPHILPYYTQDASNQSTFCSGGCMTQVPDPAPPKFATAPNPNYVGYIVGSNGTQGYGQIDHTVCIGPTSCGWHQVKELPPAPPTFWTFRKSWKDAPLRTNRQAFDKKFIILHGLGAAAMIVACKRKNSGETFGSEVPAVAGVMGLDYVATRFFSESMSIEPPVYEMAHYIWSASK